MKTDAKKIVGLGVVTAIVVVLQLMGAFIKFGPFSVSLVFVPIVVGAALYGYKAGAWLGFVFGIAVLISGDAALFFSANQLGTILTVIVKGICAGAVIGLVYRLISKKNKYLGVITSAIAGPIVNTGIFLIGCKLFFMETVTQLAQNAGMGDNIGAYMLVGFIGLNFVFEVLISIILSPIVIRLLNIRGK